MSTMLVKYCHLNYSVFCLFAVMLLGNCSGMPEEPLFFPDSSHDGKALSIEVKKALLSGSLTATASISVSSEDDIVQLRGYVSSQQAVEEAVRIAYTIKGVRFVTDHLYVN